MAFGNLVCLGLFVFQSWVCTAITLFNGAQEVIFEDATTECLAAFNSSLDCSVKAQMLSYDLDRLDFNETDLTGLCTAHCFAGLQELETTVKDACGNYDFEFNGAYLSAVQVVDLFLYKYNMSCLADSSGSFCLMVEQTWDVGALNASGSATWPIYTNKTFPYFSDDNYDGTPLEDVDGNLVDNSDPPVSFTDYGLELPLGGQDYFSDGISLDWEGHGLPEALEYDEYPLEIQCSECFLAQYKQGIESQWGEVFEAGPLVWNSSATCDQTIEYTAGGEDNYTTANEIARRYNVPTAALVQLNSISWNSVGSGSYCAPLSCQVALVEETTDAQMYVRNFDNVTETQFWTWNSYMDSKNLIGGEVVCIGPPGGAYTPVSGAVPTPSVYTTTATPAVETPAGTIPNCGLYYEVQSGDECNTVALAYGLTLDDFIAMNPEIDANCTNLLLAYDYCVAKVNGTTITSTTVSTSTSATASIVPAPTQTVTGTTNQCYKWYTVQSGDTCSSIDDKYGISLSRFRALNTYVDEVCDNLFLDYAYCINGIPLGTGTSTTSVSKTSAVTAKVLA